MSAVHQCLGTTKMNKKWFGGSEVSTGNERMRVSLMRSEIRPEMSISVERWIDISAQRLVFWTVGYEPKALCRGLSRQRRYGPLNLCHRYFEIIRPILLLITTCGTPWNLRDWNGGPVGREKWWVFVRLICFLGLCLIPELVLSLQFFWFSNSNP